jgi:SAM-dependent methyltransferase
MAPVMDTLKPSADAARVASRRELPERYNEVWRGEFDAAVEDFLVPDVSVLDIGAGRTPAIAPQDRPSGCHYVGLDISESELDLAGKGAYDEVIVADIAVSSPSKWDAFDVAVSWQALEHVTPLEQAFANIHGYLRPGGALVAQVSGRYSLFAVANRLLPERIGARALRSLLNRDPETVFPAYYDHCYASALAGALADWSSVRIVPRFRGAVYLEFSGWLERLYLRYEDWAVRSRHANLATHYLVVATK